MDDLKPAIRDRFRIRSILTLELLEFYLLTYDAKMAKKEWESHMLNENAKDVWLHFQRELSKESSTTLPVMIEVVCEAAEKQIRAGEKLTDKAE